MCKYVSVGGGGVVMQLKMRREGGALYSAKKWDAIAPPPFTYVPVNQLPICPQNGSDRCGTNEMRTICHIFFKSFVQNPEH